MVARTQNACVAASWSCAGRAQCAAAPSAPQILGKDDRHLGACGVELVGNDTHAMVAVSTKYLSTNQGFWQPTMGACGKCMVRPDEPLHA